MSEFVVVHGSLIVLSPQCSVTCEKGVSMRAVKCRVSTSLLEDSACDASKRPQDTRPCFMGSCPTAPPLTTTTTTALAPQAAFWRFGSWTEVSQLCNVVLSVLFFLISFFLYVVFFFFWGGGGGIYLVWCYFLLLLSFLRVLFPCWSFYAGVPVSTVVTLTYDLLFLLSVIP